MKVIFFAACFVWGSIFMPYEDKDFDNRTTTIEVGR
jgi:hypothetical protein